MTTEQAIDLANQIKRPHQRRPLDKLTTAADVSAGVTALNKRFEVLGGLVMDMQKRVDQIVADVEYLQDFQPGQPSRRYQS